MKKKLADANRMEQARKDQLDELYKQNERLVDTNSEMRVLVGDEKGDIVRAQVERVFALETECENLRKKLEKERATIVLNFFNDFFMVCIYYFC